MQHFRGTVSLMLGDPACRDPVCGDPPYCDPACGESMLGNMALANGVQC